jgi:hypothetical protein
MEVDEKIILPPAGSDSFEQFHSLFFSFGQKILTQKLSIVPSQELVGTCRNSASPT